MAEGKLGPCMQCVRFMLFVFNAFFWVSRAMIVCNLQMLVGVNIKLWFRLFPRNVAFKAWRIPDQQNKSHEKTRSHYTVIQAWLLELHAIIMWASNKYCIADIRFIKTTLCQLVCLSKLYGKFAIASLVCRRNSFLYVNDAMDLSIQEEGEELGRSW